VHFLAVFVFVLCWTLGHDCARHGTRGDDSRTGLTPASAKKLLIHIMAEIAHQGSSPNHVCSTVSALYFLASPSDDKPNSVFDVEDA
jgi:hypothetical protein